MRSVTASLSFAALALVGCGASGTSQTPPVTADAAVTPDASVTADVPTTPPEDVPTSAGRPYPAGPYGSSVCRRLESFTLNTCDGTPWSMNADGWDDAAATLVIIGAVWCVPCQMEAGQLERVLAPYRERGVRVVSVLVQNADRSAISVSSCNAWRTRYRLENIPLLMDPAQSLSPYYPGLAFPGNLIVDRRGVIRYRAYGTSTGLTSITSALDDILAAPDTCN